MLLIYLKYAATSALVGRNSHLRRLKAPLLCQSARFAFVLIIFALFFAAVVCVGCYKCNAAVRRAHSIAQFRQSKLFTKYAKFNEYSSNSGRQSFKRILAKNTPALLLLVLTKR